MVLTTDKVIHLEIEQRHFASSIDATIGFDPHHLEHMPTYTRCNAFAQFVGHITFEVQKFPSLSPRADPERVRVKMTATTIDASPCFTARRLSPRLPGAG